MTDIGAVIHKLCNIVFAVLCDEKQFVLISLEEHLDAYSKPAKLPFCWLVLVMTLAVSRQNHNKCQSPVFSDR